MGSIAWSIILTVLRRTFMKRTVLTGIVFFLLAVTAFAQEAVIKNITGSVEVKSSKDAQWVKAKIGDVLGKNSYISTGFKSNAIIAVGNSNLTVRSLTQLSLDELQKTGSSEQVALNLRTGRVRADVKPPAGGKVDFTVRSPSATASVRGTVFDFDTVNLNVREGTVAFSGSTGWTVLVSEGGSSEVNVETGKTSEPMEVAVAALDPVLPAGAAESGVSVTPPASAAASGDVSMDLKWHEIQ
jgi:hypothetical protein